MAPRLNTYYRGLRSHYARLAFICRPGFSGPREEGRREMPPICLHNLEGLQFVSEYLTCQDICSTYTGMSGTLVWTVAKGPQG